VTEVSTIIAPFTVGVIALITYLFFRYQHQANGLLEAFKVLNTEQHRTARAKVYQLHKSYKVNKDLNIFFIEEVRKVRADYDQMGTMVRGHSIDKKQFLRQYGPSAYLCWKFLEDHIKYERELRNFPPYMVDFQWLVEQAMKYWQKQGQDLSTVRIHNEGVVIS
jgi:hypothetical protein